MMNTIYLVLTFLICTEEKSNCLDRDSLEPFKTCLKSAMVETGLQNCVINCKCAPDLNIKCEIMANFNTMQFMIIIILALLRYYNNLGSINLLKVSSQLPLAASILTSIFPYLQYLFYIYISTYLHCSREQHLQPGGTAAQHILPRADQVPQQGPQILSRN